MLFLPLLCGLFAVATLFTGPPIVNTIVSTFQATLSNPSYNVVRGISRMVHTLLGQVVSVYTAQDINVTPRKGYMPLRITPSTYQYVPPSRVHDIFAPRPMNTPTFNDVWHFNCTAPQHLYGDADSVFGQKAIYASAFLTAVALIILGLTVTALIEWRFAKTRSLEYGAVEESTAPIGSITIVASPVFEVSHPLLDDAIMTVAFPIGEESEALVQHDVAVVDLAFAHPIPQGLASPVSEGSPILDMAPQETTAPAPVAQPADIPLPDSPILPPVGLPRQLAELANQDASSETLSAARALSDIATRPSIDLELSVQTVRALDAATPVATAVEDAAEPAIASSPATTTSDVTPANTASQSTDATTAASSPLVDTKESQVQVKDSSMSTSSTSKPIGKAAPASEDTNGGLAASIHATAPVESVSGLSASMWATAPAAPPSLASRRGLSASMRAKAPKVSRSPASRSGLSASMWATAPTAAPSLASSNGSSASMWATAPTAAPSLASSNGSSASMWATAPTAAPSLASGNGSSASMWATAPKASPSLASGNGSSASMWATAPTASPSLASGNGSSASMWATAPTASPSLASGNGSSASMWATAPSAESPSRKLGSGSSASMWATAPEPSPSRTSNSGLSASIWATSPPASSPRASTAASARGSNRYRGSPAVPKGPNPSRKSNVARQSHIPTAPPASSAAPIASGPKPPRPSSGLAASIHAPQAARAAPSEFGSAQQAPASSVANGLAALASVARDLVPPTEVPATVKDSSLDAPRPQDQDDEVFVYPGTTTLDLEGQQEDDEFHYPQADETSGESGKQQAPVTTAVEPVKATPSNDNGEDASLVAPTNGSDSLATDKAPTDTPLSAPTCRRTRSLSAPGNCLPRRDQVDGSHDLHRPSSSPPSCARQIDLPHRDTKVDRPAQEVQGGVAPSTPSDGSVTPTGSSSSVTSQPKYYKAKPRAPIVPRVISLMEPDQFKSAEPQANDEDPLEAIVRTIRRLEAEAVSTEKLPEDYWSTERVVATSQSIKEEATRITEKWEVDAVKTEIRRAVRKFQRKHGGRKPKAA